MITDTKLEDEERTEIKDLLVEELRMLLSGSNTIAGILQRMTDKYSFTITSDTERKAVHDFAAEVFGEFYDESDKVLQKIKDTVY